MILKSKVCKMITDLAAPRVEEALRVMIEGIPKGTCHDDLYDIIIEADIAGEYYQPFSEAHKKVRDIEFAVINSVKA